MNTAEITVAYKNEPKPGKKMWSIKDQNGTYYNLFPSDAGKFQVGQTYHIQFETNEQGFHTIKTPRGNSGAAPAQSRPPAPGGLVASAARAGHDAATSRVIFATGTIQQTLQGSGTYPDEVTLYTWLMDAFSAFDRAIKAHANKAATPFDDEIPFA